MRRVGGVFSQYEDRDAEIAKEAIAMNRRTFLGTTAAALASGRRSLAASAEAQTPRDNRFSPQQRKNLPIGIFNPPFPRLVTGSDARKVFQPQ